MKPTILIAFFALLAPISIYSQDQESVLKTYSNQDSTHFKVVLRTEEDTGVRNVALDNMTARFKEDTTVIYYTHYGDMLISSLTIPYNIIDRYIELEEELISRACSEDCTYSIVIKVGNKESRIPIDVLDVEKISTFMLKLEE